jgi:hypothetical protein
VSEKKAYTINVYRQRTGAKAPHRLLELRKEQLDVGNRIMKALADGPKTVPEVSQATGIPARRTLWYLMTYLKYGIVSPAGKTEEGYYKYAVVAKRKGGA